MTLTKINVEIFVEMYDCECCGAYDAVSVTDDKGNDWYYDGHFGGTNCPFPIKTYSISETKKNARKWYRENGFEAKISVSDKRM
uniref:Phage protein n=1 Tax=Rhizobium phage IG49 TaxID=3129228 RepID=A0AAU8HYE9_9CAUD